MHWFVRLAKESLSFSRRVGQKWEALKGTGEEKDSSGVWVETWRQGVCLYVCSKSDRRSRGKFASEKGHRKANIEMQKKNFNDLKNIPRVIALVKLWFLKCLIRTFQPIGLFLSVPTPTTFHRVLDSKFKKPPWKNKKTVMSPESLRSWVKKYFQPVVCPPA